MRSHGDIDKQEPSHINNEKYNIRVVFEDDNVGVTYSASAQELNQNSIQAALESLAPYKRGKFSFIISQPGMPSQIYEGNFDTATGFIFTNTTGENIKLHTHFINECKKLYGNHVQFQINNISKEKYNIKVEFENEGRVHDVKSQQLNQNSIQVAFESLAPFNRGKFSIEIAQQDMPPQIFEGVFDQKHGFKFNNISGGDFKLHEYFMNESKKIYGNNIQFQNPNYDYIHLNNDQKEIFIHTLLDAIKNGDHSSVAQMIKTQTTSSLYHLTKDVMSIGARLRNSQFYNAEEFETLSRLIATQKDALNRGLIQELNRWEDRIKRVLKDDKWQFMQDQDSSRSMSTKDPKRDSIMSLKQELINLRNDIALNKIENIESLQNKILTRTTETLRIHEQKATNPLEKIAQIVTRPSIDVAALNNVVQDLQNSTRSFRR